MDWRVPGGLGLRFNLMTCKETEHMVRRPLMTSIVLVNCRLGLAQTLRIAEAFGAMLLIVRCHICARAAASMAR